MRRRKARVLLEHRLQKLLLEYIYCWEQYCRVIPQQNVALVALHLDHFIVILQNMKQILKMLSVENKITIPEHNLHYEMKNILKKKE